MNRLNSTDSGSKWATADRKHRLTVAHQYGKRQRHQFRLEQDELVASPLITGTYVASSMSCYLVVDLPVGYDVASAKAVVDGFIANLSASTGANITKLLGGES